MLRGFPVSLIRLILTIVWPIVTGQERFSGIGPFRAMPSQAKVFQMTIALYHRLARKMAVGSVFLLFAALTFAFLANFPQLSASAQQASHHKSSPPKTAPAKPPDLPMPFHSGETLNYRIAWTAFSSAASAQFSVVEQRDLYGWSTWHFRVFGHTMGSVRSLFSIDDQVDSYTDTSSLESRQFEMYLNQMGRQDTKVFHLIPSGEISRASGPSILVMAGTRDPVGEFYALRGVDWKTTPEVHAPVYDGQDLYQVRARAESLNESVSVPAGTYSCTRIAVEIFQYDKQIPGVGATLWFANDAARTPVHMLAILPFGNLNVELISP